MVYAARICTRFDDRVIQTDTCWLWTGPLNEKGYARCWNGKAMEYVHRFTYRRCVGKIPKGAEVDHRCHVRHCVNPRHLRLATHKQNQENRSGPQVNNLAGARGVSWNKRVRRWYVRVQHHGKTHSGGYFAELEDAKQAAVALRNSLYTHNTEYMYRETHTTKGTP